LLAEGRQISDCWRLRLLDDDTVRAWSHRMLERISGDDVPDWLFDLATLGPHVRSARPSAEFIDVPWLDFGFEFSLRVRTLDTGNHVEVDEFLSWIMRACMGLDTSRPDAAFGYWLDHLYDDGERPDLAREELLRKLPALKTELAPVPAELVRLVTACKTTQRVEARHRQSGGRKLRYRDGDSE
jgi:hypothetical protein